MALRGVIFDLDGTLIDSRLDFDAMRREMGFPEGQLILEGVAALPDGERRERCLTILHEHERRGAESATLMPGAQDMLAGLSARGFPLAILTRNSRAMTQLALQRLQLEFSHVLTREDAPPKPDPAGLWHICQAWQLSVDEVIFVGDYRFDLVAGRAAGIATVLYAPDGPPDYAKEADFVVGDLRDVIRIAALLAEPNRASAASAWFPPAESGESLPRHPRTGFDR
ncbi:MAG: HAD family hydrolase [Planctomycetaceae bacterium]|nr:HAD family hydrolase [Planctomycetaceae bacterium]